MRFEVNRASQYDNDYDNDPEPPCEEAVRGQIESRAYGTPHMVKDVWFIELSNLKALLAFREKYGSLFLGVSVWDKQTPTITIYDSYVE